MAVLKIAIVTFNCSVGNFQLLARFYADFGLGLFGSSCVLLFPGLPVSPVAETQILSSWSSFLTAPFASRSRGFS